jgi:hypothetical protein
MQLYLVCGLGMAPVIGPDLLALFSPKLREMWPDLKEAQHGSEAGDLQTIETIQMGRPEGDPHNP